MKIPMSWLKEYVDLDCKLEEFIGAMTMSGSKVEAVEILGEKLSGIIVGEILAIEKHPNADKLLITKIDIGEKKSIQIVTGASNVFVGAIVPVAVDGAVLANDLIIVKGELRGEISEGMLCSISELGYDKHDYPESPEDGIYIFQEKQSLGADVVPILQLREEVVEYELTSNRVDCFSVIGIAREASATFKKTFKYPQISVKENGKELASDLISVEIKNPDLCPRYIARVINDVKIAPSPQWLRHRLTASGIRPINNIVDITNYVMLELGQPMHAFDIQTVDERKIIIRNAEKGEKFVTLDGEEHILDNSMLVISDKNKALALAGIMGGENSMITENARTVLLESANFDGTNIRISSKKLGMRTDSSGTFEKGLDPNLAEQAINRAAQLIEELGCGTVVRGLVDEYPKKRENWTVPYKAESINKLLAINLTAAEMENILSSIDVKTVDGIAKIPTFRPDLQLEVDIAEEIARLFGYDNIEATLFSGTSTVGKRNRKQQIEDITKETMVSLGFMEALTYSFESPKVYDKLLIPEDSVLRNYIVISNPLGEDFSVMRTTPFNGLLTSLGNNFKKRNEIACLFEISNIYIPKTLPLAELPHEKPVLAIALYGGKDFYDIKGAVQNLAERLGIFGLDFSPISDISYLHPGRAATVSVGGELLGYLGELNSIAAKNYEIGQKAYIAEISMELLVEKARIIREYENIPRYPGIKRDIAIIIEENVLAKDVEKVIKENAGELFEMVELFDVYKGEHLKQGFKSMAYSIQFRAAERTLKDEEVATATEQILDSLKKAFGAVLRS